MRNFLAAFLLLSACSASAQQAQPPSKFIRENSPVIALTHVQLIDGTGAAAQADRTIVMDHGKILAVGPAAITAAPTGAKVIDAKGKTAIPGLVGMHERLFYPAANEGDPIFIEQPFSFPQLYLASSVTTVRTTGSVEPYTDLQVKARVDSGKLPGPEFYLTTPYLEGSPSAFLQMHPLKNADEARAFVDYWHSVGFTSLKAYVDVKPDELRAGIEGAHKLGMKVTGHLCSVRYIEAAETGIDDLEHGPYGAPDGELFSNKQPGVCVGDFSGYFSMIAEIVKRIEPDGPELRKTIDVLVAHHVAVTSTLAVFEAGSRPAMNSGFMKKSHELMSPQTWSQVMTLRAKELEFDRLIQTLLQKEMKFEHKFVAAGGLLLAGSDPTGSGQVLAGLGDQRQVELLVEAGFTPVEAIHIATQNGATLLGAADRIGSIAAGHQADLVLLDGDLAKDITVIEKPEIVFKAGVGYDSNAIYDSLRGQVGLQRVGRIEESSRRAGQCRLDAEVLAAPSAEILHQRNELLPLRRQEISHLRRNVCGRFAREDSVCLQLAKLAGQDLFGDTGQKIPNLCESLRPK
jgi:Amidohydrolase family